MISITNLAVYMGHMVGTGLTQLLSRSIAEITLVKLLNTGAVNNGCVGGGVVVTLAQVLV